MRPDFRPIPNSANLFRQRVRNPRSAADSSVLAVDEEPAWLYVSDHSARTSIEVLDPKTFATVASLDLDPRLIGGMAFSPSGERLYATLWSSASATPRLPAQIAIVDTTANRILERITLGADTLPSKPVISTDGKLLYFADRLEGLVVVDLESRTVIERIPAARAGGVNNQFTSLGISPDGGLICLTDSAGVGILDTRTRTFVARINISLPNREIVPVFNATGTQFYLIERRSVPGGLAVSLVGFDTSEVRETSRTALPSTFDPHELVMTPDGLSLAIDGFLRAPNQPVKVGFIVVDATRNVVVSINDAVQPLVGALGVMRR